MKCRHCYKPLFHTFLDLGFAPLSNAYLTEEDLKKPEIYYPLKVKVCDSCWLVQAEDYATVDTIFTPKYAYFSSTSESWLSHATRYSEQIITNLCLDEASLVIEIASNDGYLLKNFVRAGIPCLGIEPTESTALAAEALGIRVVHEFFDQALGQQLSKNGYQADLLIGNNVYAHVPDINDFTRGLKALLKQGGTITLEFPHLMRLLENNQFDTIYHEHYSYLSLFTVCKIFSAAGLRVWNVEELQTHGGSLRVYGCHADDTRSTRLSVSSLIEREQVSGLQKLETYLAFQPRADKIKDDLISFLIDKKRNGKKLVAYGAAAKGNTLLNYAGIKKDLISFVCDAAKSKQGRFLPGSHIPIYPPGRLEQENPDYVLILPWNIAQEILVQTAPLVSSKTKFVTVCPDLYIQ